jgi:NADH-quinone oxidoreductase subunit N
VFVGKLTVFTAALDGGFAWLVVLAVVNTVASVFYYLRWLAPAFRGDGADAVLEPGGRWATAAAHGCAAAAVLLGVLGGAALRLLTEPPAL